MQRNVTFRTEFSISSIVLIKIVLQLKSAGTKTIQGEDQR